MEIPRDALLVLQDRETAQVVAAALDLEDHAGVAREELDQLELGVGERFCSAQPTYRERPCRLAVRRQGNPHRRTDDPDADLRLLRPSVLRGISHHDHAAGRSHLTGDAVRGSEAAAAQLGRGRSGHDVDRQLAGTVRQRHARHVGSDELPCPIGDELQDASVLAPRSDGLDDVVNGGECGVAPTHPPEQAGVLDDDPGGGGEAGYQLLVEIGEGLRRRLVGQIQVPEHLTPGDDRHAEERRHRRVVRREAGAAGVLGDHRHPQRSGVLDQGAEQTEPLRRSTDRPAGGVVDPGGEEGGEAALVLVEHPECAVSGVDQRGGGLHDVLERPIEVQLPADRQHGVEELAEASRSEMIDLHAQPPYRRRDTSSQRRRVRWVTSGFRRTRPTVNPAGGLRTSSRVQRAGTPSPVVEVGGSPRPLSHQSAPSLVRRGPVSSCAAPATATWDEGPNLRAHDAVVDRADRDLGPWS